MAIPKQVQCPSPMRLQEFDLAHETRIIRNLGKLRKQLVILWRKELLRGENEEKLIGNRHRRLVFL